MKNIFGLVSCLFILLISGCSGGKKTMLDISFQYGKDTLLNIWYPGALYPETLTVDPTAGKVIGLSLEDISAVSLMYGNIYTQFYMEPGKRCKILFDFSSRDNKKVIYQDTVMQLYSEMMKGRDIYKYEWVRNYSVEPLDTNGHRMLANFKELIVKDNRLFENLDMSDALRKTIQNNNELYWLASLSKVIRANNSEEIRSGKPMYEDYREAWDSIYSIHPLNRKDKFLPGWFLHYAEIYTGSYADYKFGGFLENMDTEERLNKKTERAEKLIKDKNVLEEFLSLQLVSMGYNNKTRNRVVVDQIRNFLEKYPQNRNREYLLKHRDEVEVYHSIVSGDFPEGVEFVTDYENLSSLKEVFSCFKGKPVFIDFWFCTCGPCIEQFAYAKELKEFLNAEGIQMVYISIDRPEQEENWQNAIKYYKLTGKHIRTSQALHEDMHLNYGINAFPHYMLVNAEGQVVIKDALFPEDKERLYTQITETL